MIIGGDMIAGFKWGILQMSSWHELSVPGMSIGGGWTLVVIAIVTLACNRSFPAPPHA